MFHFPSQTISRFILLVGFLSLFFGIHAEAASVDRVGETGIKELPSGLGWPEESGTAKKLSAYKRGDFIVEGIVFHSDIGKRSVYIRKKGSEFGKVLHVGDMVGPFRLSVIEDSSVTLYHVDRILILELETVEFE